MEVEQLEVEQGRPERGGGRQGHGMHEWLNTLLIVVLFGYVAVSLDKHSDADMMSANQIQASLRKMHQLSDQQKTSFQSEMSGLNLWSAQLQAKLNGQADRVTQRVKQLDDAQSRVDQAAQKRLAQLQEAMQDQQSVNDHADAAAQAVKEWTAQQLRQQAAQDDAQLEQFRGEMNGKLSHIASEMTQKVNSADAQIDRKVEKVENALDDTQASTQFGFNKTKQQMAQFRTEVNQDLTDVTNQMAQKVNSADSQIDRKVEKVEDALDDTEETTQFRFNVTQHQFKSQQQFMVDHLAGMFALLACVIAIAHVARHLQEFEKPMVQRKILSILWMVPIYAFTSWLTLALTVSGSSDENGFGGGVATGMGLLRDFYEAYVIYMFFAMMVAIVGDGDDDKVVQLLSSRSDSLQMPFQLCYCSGSSDTSRMFAARVLARCRVCAMQFVFVKPVAAISLVFLSQKFGEEQCYNWRLPLLWVSVALNTSTAIAFYGLLKFYHAMSPELLWCSPWPKFLCIKGVVFMTYWQSTTLGTFGQLGILDRQYVPAIQNFLICIEMFIAAVIHFFVFPPVEWRVTYRAIPGAPTSGSALGDNLAVHDFVSDLKGLWSSDPSEPQADEAGYSEASKFIFSPEEAIDTSPYPGPAPYVGNNNSENAMVGRASDVEKGYGAIRLDE